MDFTKEQVTPGTTTQDGCYIILQAGYKRPEVSSDTYMTGSTTNFSVSQQSSFLTVILIDIFVVKINNNI